MIRGKAKILLLTLTAMLYCSLTYAATESEPLKLSTLKLSIPSDYYSFGFYEDEGGSIGLTDLTLYYDSSSSVTTTSNTLYASNTFYVGWTIASRYSLNIVMNVDNWSPTSVSFVAKTETGKTALSVGENIVTTLPVGTVGTGIKEYLVTVSLDGVQKDSSYTTTATLMVVVI